MRLQIFATGPVDLARLAQWLWISGFSKIYFEVCHGISCFFWGLVFSYFVNALFFITKLQLRFKTFLKNEFVEFPSFPTFVSQIQCSADKPNFNSCFDSWHKMEHSYPHFTPTLTSPFTPLHPQPHPTPPRGGPWTSGSFIKDPIPINSFLFCVFFNNTCIFYK